ncbi:hypothetical protein HGP14_30550 [Rhizobium sp. P32RR-XVIII]|uniref:hypothetical protein n=1 Tax=Rhizobium sp. P32RR-XVIII TaxID=2726738 RepID=UPI00145668FB|nr:hypothetical protein [Rhizobium sp. P32RR-XVIII]NLS07606.1 hypothetical protein [Rhizobium sp. P32RR-XVIII]
MAIFVIALGAVVILAASTRGAGMAAIVYALPVMVGGAAIYALGAILTNLIAIREASDRQAAALTELVAQRRTATLST